jgi:predicted DCC family thiol-disulfide oxidoreductase YuxK
VYREAGAVQLPRPPLAPGATSERVLVLYDADCGICTQTARVLSLMDRGRRLELVALQAADEIPGAPAADVLRTALHARDRQGHWTSGGDAVVQILGTLPILWPMAVWARLPGARWLIGRTYDAVAANRHRLSRRLGLTVCPVDRVHR